MRSVWDRLSSGAGTALSAVQDAYGNARDARANTGGSPGELQDWSSASPRRASPSVNAASTPSTLSRFEPPPVTQAVRASTFSSVSTGTAVNPWVATSSSPSLPSSSSTSPRDAGRGGMPSVLVDNPWNTARTHVQGGARRPPLEDAFAVGGMAAALPPLPRVVDPLGNESSTSHNGLPADPSVALPPAPLSASASASASPIAPTAPRVPSLDAPLGISPSSADSEAPKLELSGISEEMDPLGVGIR